MLTQRNDYLTQFPFFSLFMSLFFFQFSLIYLWKNMNKYFKEPVFPSHFFR